MASLLSWGIGRVRDLVDANTREDQRKRLAAGQPRFYDDQQRRLGNKAPASNPFEQARNIGVGLARGTARGVTEVANVLPDNNIFLNPAITAALRTAQQPLGTERKSTPQGPVVIPKGPTARFIYGREPIKSSTQAAKELTKDVTGKQLPTAAALPLGLFLSSPVGPGKGKGVIKNVAKNTAKTNLPKTILKASSKNQLSQPKVPLRQPTVSQKMSSAVEASKNRYKPTLEAKIRNKVASGFDPYSELVKVDKTYAAKIGMKYRDLPANERLDYMADRTAYSGRQADEIIKTPTRTGQSGEELIKKYGSGDASKEFNNYTNAKFDLEFRSKHRGRPIQSQYKDDELAAFVKDYEARNPEAIRDLATKKALNDTALDIIAEGGGISKAEAEFVKNYYENAVPLGRVVSENLERPDIAGRSVGSIGRQSVLQRLEGNSQIPLDDSFEPLVSRINKAVSQANRAKLAKAYLERAQQGVAPGDLIVGAGNKAARKDLTAQSSAIKGGIKSLEKRIGLTNRQARNIQSQLNKLNRKGIELRTSTKPETTLAGKAAGLDVKVTSQEMRNIMSALVKTDPAGLAQIKKSIVVREPKLAAKLDQVSEYQKQVAGNKEARGILRENIAQLQDDPTTGKQVISGLVDGESFKLEVPPEVARAMQGLDQQKLNTVLKGLNVPMKVFQTAWTGFLNPVFSGISFALYDTPMTVINSKLGFRTFGARAIGESFKSINSNSEFQRLLAKNGAQLIGGSQLPQDITRSAEAIAARKNLFTKVKFNAANPSEALRSLDIFGGKLANATRTRVAKAHQVNALKNGATPQQAAAEAAYAYNNVLPNYGRTSALAQQLNTVIPYVGASTAGTRSLATALRNNPYAAVKLAGVGIAPMIATTAYSLSSDEGQAFVEDMQASGKEYLLDNNMVVVLPGAEKNSETGEWTGVIKIPIAPELRALNKVAWRETNRFVNGQNGGSPAQTATSLFDFATGGLRTQENPLIDTGKIALGIDPRSSNFDPKPLIKGDIAELDKKDQKYSTTSGNAKRISDLTGNKISPVQADAILGQFSTAGRLAQNRDGNPVKTLAGTVGSRFTGAYGEKDSTKFYNTLDKVSKEISAIDDRKVFSALHSKKDKNSRSLDKQAEKYKIFLARPKVFEAEKKLDQFNRKQGKPGNPIFDLTPEQQNAVMRYRGAKDLNSAKQAYDKNGNPLFTALGLDEQWYEDFRNKENEFYSRIKGTSDESSPLSYSGAVKPKDSPQLEALKNQYYSLPKGTGARSAFIKSHPEILDSWAADNQFTNAERVALGLKVSDDASFGSSASGNSYGSGYSRGSGSGGSKKLSINTSGFNTAKGIKAPPAPKISVKKLSPPKGKAKKKLSVKKIPSNYLNKKLS